MGFRSDMADRLEGIKTDLEGRLPSNLKGQSSLEGLAYGILIVAVVIMVGIYLITQVGSIVQVGGSATVNASVANVTSAFATFATLLTIVVLVGVLAIVVAMLRGGFGGARQM